MFFTKFFHYIVLALCFIVPQASSASWFSLPSDAPDICKELFEKYANDDIAYIQNFDRAAQKKERVSCAKYMRSKSEVLDDFYFTCELVKRAADRGEIAVIKSFERIAGVEESLSCMRRAAEQNYPNIEKRQQQFHAFRYVVNWLLSKKLVDQQTFLDETLYSTSNYNLSLHPEFTEYMLRVGANPKFQTKNVPYSGTDNPTMLSGAMSIVNDWGDCKTPRLLINALSSESLGLQNKQGQTALMQSIIKYSPCYKELLLLVQKSAGLNLADNKGNTALHYLLMSIGGAGFYTDDYKLVARALIHKGVSLQHANKKGITAQQLRDQLKANGCKGC